MGALDNPEAAFIARMTASATHELRNVLAVVKESAGLIEDLTLAQQREHPGSAPRLLQATQRIDAQVSRAAILLTSLNRLAHGLDHPTERLDLGEQVRQAVFLSQRFARQRRQRVDVAGNGPDVLLRANALWLHMVLAAAIDCCVEQLPDGSTITLQVGGGRPAVAFVAAVSGGGRVYPTAARSWRHLVALLDQAGGAAGSTSEPFGFEIVFAEDGTGS